MVVKHQKILNHLRRVQYVGVDRHIVGVLEPLVKERLQLTHILEAEVERLEARDRRLAEVVAVQLAHGEADVALRETCNRWIGEILRK